MLLFRSYPCQKAFGQLNVPGVGRGSGEPAEIFNSVFGPHGAVTQYMSPAHREAHLERIAWLYCLDVIADLPGRLERMRVRCEAALGAAEHRIALLAPALAEASDRSLAEVGEAYSVFFDC